MRTPQETCWRVHTLPRMDGVEYTLYLTTPSVDPVVVAAIERAAALAAMVITRVDDEAGSDV